MAYLTFGEAGAPLTVVVPGLTDGLAPVFDEAGREAVSDPPPAFRDRHVVVVSHRDPAPSGLGTKDMARDLARFLQQVVDGTPAVLVGHSMGGMVAQHLAAEHPPLVQRLVLSSTVSCADEVFSSRLRRWEELIVQQSWRDFYRDALDASFVGGARWLQRALLRLRRAHAPDPYLAERHLVMSRACREHDARSRLGAIGTPTLVLNGLQDVLTRPIRARELAESIPGAKLLLVQGAGHGLPEQRGSAYVRAIRTFLDGGPDQESDP